MRRAERRASCLVITSPRMVRTTTRSPRRIGAAGDTMTMSPSRNTGSIDSPNGPVNVGFTFKATGATLTGTTTGPDGMEVAIKEGKIEGNNLSFKVTLDFGGMPLELSYKGVMAGMDMKMTIDFMGMPIELAVKKAK